MDQIVEDVDDFPISVAEAKELRLHLMAERRGYEQLVDQEFESATFNFCEH